MASAQKAKPASRWGFLSQAVASVESRLDTILGEEEDASKETASPELVNKENVAPSRGSMDSARGNPIPQTNDRLQERLAKAMAKKTAGRVDNHASGSEPVSGRETPITTEPRTSLQQTNGDATTTDTNGSQVGQDVSEAKEPVVSLDTNSVRQSEEILSRLGIPTINSESQRPSIDNTLHNYDSSPRQPFNDVDSSLLNVQLEHEAVKSEMQNEINGYIERIDALNAKLQYLAKEAAQSAKDGAQEADPTSLERQIHEKNEKIALLLEEGRKLSVTERKNLDIIKKLRSQSVLSNKDQDAIRKRAEKTESEITALDLKAKKAEEAARKAEAQLVSLSKASSDLEAVTRERNALKQTLTDMKAQVVKANARAENAEASAQGDKLEIEQKKVTELQDDLTSAKLEHKLAQDKFRKEIADVKAEIIREKAQSKSMESEMLAEQAALESKLESFRVRAEEASSNDQGDSQAKLLRQIETLQSQYATASQNWQGIEGTLLARITTLESERDEVVGREADVRKKSRDAILKAKSSEKELEEIQAQLGTLTESQSDAKMEVQRLMRRNEQFEDDLSRTRKDIEEQKTRLEREYVRKLEEEKTKWAMSIQRVRTESPSNSGRKASGYVVDHLTSPPLVDRPFSRRSSALNMGFSEAPSKSYYNASMRGVSNGVIPETPSIVTSPAVDQDEYFSGMPATPSSQEHATSRRGLNDLISTSTVGVGPSVQLVERMSANVRRLENEKAASKDELIRLTTQRDESRQEVVRLMQEVKVKSTVESRLKQLEQEHDLLSKRYQTTLELLGEKSELVEELKQDIVDVKEMYRQLADHMK